MIAVLKRPRTVVDRPLFRGDDNPHQQVHPKAQRASQEQGGKNNTHQAFVQAKLIGDTATNTAQHFVAATVEFFSFQGHVVYRY